MHAERVATAGGQGDPNRAKTTRPPTANPAASVPTAGATERIWARCVLTLGQAPQAAASGAGAVVAAVPHARQRPYTGKVRVSGESARPVLNAVS